MEDDFYFVLEAEYLIEIVLLGSRHNLCEAAPSAAPNFLAIRKSPPGHIISLLIPKDTLLNVIECAIWPVASSASSVSK